MKRLAERVDLALQHLRLFESHVGGGRGDFHQPQVAGAEHRLVDLERRIVPRRQQVAGEVLSHKAVIRHVGVEGPHAVVAVPPGLGDRIVADIAAGFTESHQVEPIARPVLAEGGAGQQAVDEPFRCFGRGFGQKGIDLGRCWRQSGEGQGEPPQQRAAIGGASRLKARLLHGGQQKPIDRRLRPDRMVGGRWLDRFDRLPGPVAAAVGEFGGPGFGGDVGGSRRRCRQAGQPEGHPVLEIGNRPVGEPVGPLRHLAVGHLVPHQL